MARTPDLNITVNEFERAQQAVIDTWTAQKAAGLDSEILRRAAASAISTGATNWEWFRSEWHKKAIARDATVYREALVTRVRHFMHVDAGGGRKLLDALDAEGIAIDVRLPQLPTLSRINRIIDPSDNNITFRSKSESDARADAHLAPQYAAKSKSLTRDDWLVIGVLIGVRNALAHSSTRSIDAMNKALTDAGKTADPSVRALRRDGNRVTRSGIGAYLVAETLGISRVLRVSQHLHGLGALFRV